MPQLLNYAVMRRLLGLEREDERRRSKGADPLDRMNKVLDARGKMLREQSTQLDIAAKTRALMEPSEAQRAQARLEQDEQKFIMGKLKDILLDPSLSPAQRENYEGLFENHYFGLSEEMRGVLGPLVIGTPVDPMEQKARAFDKMNPATPMPVIRDGNAIINTPRDEEHAHEWARWEFREADRKYLRAMTLYGKEQGEAVAKAPTFIPITKDTIAYRDKRSGRVSLTSPNVLDIDEEKAKGWGWPLHRILAEDFVPTGEPQMAVFGGAKIEVTPGKYLSTGRARVNEEFYGAPDRKYQKIPERLSSALAIAASDVKLNQKEVADVGVREVARIFRDASKRKHRNQEEIDATLAELTAYVQALYPTLNAKVVFPQAGQRTGWWSGGYYLEGFPFMILPDVSPVQYATPEGILVTFWKSTVTGDVIDGRGQYVPEAVEANPGDVVDVSIKFDKPMLGVP